MSKREITNAEELAAACAADGISLPVAAAPAVAPTPQRIPAKEWLKQNYDWDKSGRGYICKQTGLLCFLSDVMDKYADLAVAGGAVAETPRKDRDCDCPCDECGFGEKHCGRLPCDQPPQPS